MNSRTCSIEGCAKRHYARGWCRTHYGRWQRNGTPSLANFRSPEESFAARTERRGDCLIWTGSSLRGHGQIWAGGKLMPAHRYAWERANGPIPEGMMVDHAIHCDRACCEVKHLRLATAQQNGSNRAGPRPGRVEDLPRNVRRSRSRFQVQIRSRGVVRTYGTYDTPEEAAQVAARERARLFGEFAGRG